ncbi:lipocalin family protein [Flavobacterium litorale]|uniref:Lipocalin family protein n=2 Tax=Flavobacterium litorale TaxID=2856519 RepID=A0ABX8V9C0_9FLAO|nr:lipocalin family protein [Flavobacterium litorale]
MSTFTCLLIITMSFNSHAQQSKKNVLINTWHIDTYMIQGKKYPPSRKEKNDFIQFNKDMTFFSKSEGKDENGTFIYNTNGAYIEMIDEQGGKLKAYIISITKKKLVLKFDIEELREVEIHFNAHI